MKPPFSMSRFADCGSLHLGIKCLFAFFVGFFLEFSRKRSKVPHGPLSVTPIRTVLHCYENEYSEISINAHIRLSASQK